VAELQRRLARAGYYHGSVDGVLGPQTRRAIRAYEQDHGYASQ
jgi:peptidoglycan hydrolase-like protein with peptidoglycan-binding domain